MSRLVCSSYHTCWISLFSVHGYLLSSAGMSFLTSLSNGPLLCSHRLTSETHLLMSHLLFGFNLLSTAAKVRCVKSDQGRRCLVGADCHFSFPTLGVPCCSALPTGGFNTMEPVKKHSRSPDKFLAIESTYQAYRQYLVPHVKVCHYLQGQRGA